MRYSKIGLLIALTGLMGGGAAGCGDDGFECGEGTVDMDGVCVPTDEVCGEGTTYDMASGTCLPDGGLECGEGTIEMDGECVTDLGCGTGTTQMGNECVPDGSVICTGNTVFDADSGTCVVDEAACAEGTVFAMEEGECIPFDDSLVADITETTEPNDPAFSEAAMISPFDLPAVGDTTTLGGCVEPTDFDEDGFTDADLDFFGFTITEPTTLAIQTDGVGGLAAGAIVVGIDDETYIRGIVDNTNDGAEKTIFLPRPGEYAIAVSDSRTLVPLLLGDTVLPAGDTDACYFVQITGAELPASSATLTLDTPRVGPFENGPVVYEVDSAMEQLLFLNLAELDADDEPVDFITLDGTLNALVDGEWRGRLGPPFEVGTETVTIVLESIFDLSLDPIESEVEVSGQPVQDFPESGDVTLTKTTDDFGPFDSLQYVAFDGTAGDVAHLSFDSTDSLIAAVVSPDGAISAPCGTNIFGDLLACSSSDDDYYLTTTGRHLFGFFSEDASVDGDYTVTLTRATTTPTALAVGDTATGALSTDDSAFFSLPASAADWVEYTLTDLVDLTEGVVRFYSVSDPTFGILGLEVAQGDGDVADPSFQRIYLGEADSFLVEVTDPSIVDGTETFTLGVADVPFNDLSVSEAAPVDRADEALTAGDPQLYIVRATEGSILTIDAASDGTVDAVVGVHDPIDATLDEAIDDSGAGETESLVQVIGEEGYLVLSVADFTDGGGTFDLTINATDPVTYAAAADTLSFTEICPGAGGSGTVVDDYTATSSFPALDDGWSGKLTLPFPFVYFGLERTEAFIGTNGRIAFRADAPAGAFPTFGDATGNDVLFPFSADLAVTETCVLHDTSAGQYIIQYSGTPWDSSEIVRFQVILDGGAQTVSYVFDSTHELSNADAVIGVQGPATSLAIEYTDPIAAGESVTFTPM